MTLPASGIMTANMINVELGRAGTAAFDINGTPERTLAEKPSGIIKFSDFYGKTAGSVNLLLHMDSLVNTNEIQDYGLYAANATIGSTSGVAINTSTYKFAAGSLYGPGGSGALMATLSPGTTPYPRFDMSVTNWTWEMWFNESEAASGTSLISQRLSGAVGWVIASTGLRAVVNGVWSDTALTWTRPSFGVWHYLALQKEGITLTAYIDSNRVTTRSDISTFTGPSSTTLAIGSAVSNGFENQFKGYIDEMRFTKNKARYPGSPATITPPTTAFPNS